MSHLVDEIFERSLPSGRCVRMRAARARDELRALEDFRVWLEPARFPAVLLARVLTGPDASAMTPEMIEALPSVDRGALESLYAELNDYAEITETRS